MKFPESVLAHTLLDGKRGLEIGPSAHNPFGLKTVTAGLETKDTEYAKAETDLCGEVAKLDFVCPGDDLPFKDAVFDFVLCSHVLEHFYDPIRTIEEWLRVTRPGGYVFIIFPHKDRTFDKDRARTTLEELLARHANPHPDKSDQHHTVWITEDALALCAHMKWNVVAQQDTDDKVGNGFTFVLQKPA